MQWPVPLQTARRLSPCAGPDNSLHPAARQKLLQPVDVVVAVDDRLVAHQRAEQRQRGVDAGLPIVHASGGRGLNDDSVFPPKPYSLNQVDQTLVQIGGKN